MLETGKVTLTGFADEISKELSEQLDCLNSESIRFLEFRGVWGKNVLRLDDVELKQVKAEIDARGVSVSSVGSPIGKIKITDPFEPHLEDFERAIYVAKFFNSSYIRIFSFFIPEGEDPANYREEVMRRMQALTRRAEKAGVTLLHENEKHIYGDTGERCLDILRTCNSVNLRAAYDPANFVQCGVRPFDDAFPLLKPYIEYVHIKDAVFETGQVTPAGQGDGRVEDSLAALKAHGYSGFLSLEPHLKAAGAYEGFSGPELYKEATQALKTILTNLKWTWN